MNNSPWSPGSLRSLREQTQGMRGWVSPTLIVVVCAEMLSERFDIRTSVAHHRPVRTTLNLDDKHTAWSNVTPRAAPSPLARPSPSWSDWDSRFGGQPGLSGASAFSMCHESLLR